MNDATTRGPLPGDPNYGLTDTKPLDDMLNPKVEDKGEPAHFGRSSRFLHGMMGYTPHPKHTKVETMLRNGVAMLAFVSLGYVSAASYYYASTFTGSEIANAGVALAALGGFFMIDRGFAQAENRDHVRAAAMALYNKHAQIGINMAERVTNAAMGVIKKGSRLAIAVCFSFLVGEAVGQKIFENEINAVIADRYQSANVELIQQLEDRVSEYDRETSKIQEELQTLRSEEVALIAQQNNVASGRVTIETSDVGRQTLGELEAIRQRIAQQQQQIDAFVTQVSDQDAIMRAELSGAGREGTSGIAGRGPRFDAADIEKNRLLQLQRRAEEELTVLRQDQTRLQNQIETLETEARGDLSRLRTSLPAQLESVRTRIAEKSAQLQARTTARVTVVSGFESDMERNPDYVRRQSGAVERHDALNSFIEQTPGAGLRVNLFKALFFFLELSVFLGAMSLRPARAEVDDELDAIDAENTKAAKMALRKANMDLMQADLREELGRKGAYNKAGIATDEQGIPVEEQNNEPTNHGGAGGAPNGATLKPEMR